MPTGGRRRAQGLRREEVADLAAISADYYARIEQGRRQAPPATLEAIADALRLDEAGRAYLSTLAGRATRARRTPRRQKTAAHLRLVLAQIDTLPAIVLGRRMDVLAWNPLACALITDFATLSERDRNYVRLVFEWPPMRTLYREWAKEARHCVALLHMEVARDPHDPRLTELVGELAVRDVDFRRWWSEHTVSSQHQGTKRFAHPAVGELTLRWGALAAVEDPDQQLVVWSAEPDSESAARLRQLRDQLS